MLVRMTAQGSRPTTAGANGISFGFCHLMSSCARPVRTETSLDCLAQRRCGPSYIFSLLYPCRAIGGSECWAVGVTVIFSRGFAYFDLYPRAVVCVESACFFP